MWTNAMSTTAGAAKCVWIDRAISAASAVLDTFFRTINPAAWKSCRPSRIIVQSSSHHLADTCTARVGLVLKVTNREARALCAVAKATLSVDTNPNWRGRPTRCSTNLPFSSRKRATCCPVGNRTPDWLCSKAGKPRRSVLERLKKTGNPPIALIRKMPRKNWKVFLILSCSIEIWNDNGWNDPLYWIRKEPRQEKRKR